MWNTLHASVSPRELIHASVLLLRGVSLFDIFSSNIANSPWSQTLIILGRRVRKPLAYPCLCPSGSVGAFLDRISSLPPTDQNIRKLAVVFPLQSMADNIFSATAKGSLSHAGWLSTLVLLLLYWLWVGPLSQRNYLIHCVNRRTTASKIGVVSESTDTTRLAALTRVNLRIEPRISGMFPEERALSCWVKAFCCM
jgi:hypothetical protein